MMGHSVRTLKEEVLAMRLVGLEVSDIAEGVEVIALGIAGVLEGAEGGFSLKV